MIPSGSYRLNYHQKTLGCKVLPPFGKEGVATLRGYFLKQPLSFKSRSTPLIIFVTDGANHWNETKTVWDVHRAVRRACRHEATICTCSQVVNITWFMHEWRYPGMDETGRKARGAVLLTVIHPYAVAEIEGPYTHRGPDAISMNQGA